MGQTGTVRAEDYIFSKEKQTKITKWEGFSHYRILRQFRESVTERMLYIVLRGRWCNIV